jgi:hypothetical protein
MDKSGKETEREGQKSNGPDRQRPRRPHAPGHPVQPSHKPSIRAKALSRTKSSCPVLVTPRFARVWLRTNISRHHAESLFGGASLHQPSIRPYIRDHDSSMRTSRRRAGAESGKHVFVFQGALLAPSFARASRDARAPNQFLGLASADQGLCRATLDANDLRISCVGAQHPEKSY